MPAKEPREVNRELLDQVKAQGCEVCHERPCDPAHVRSRGAGGPDTWANVVALCRACHGFQHSVGIRSFWKKFGERIQLGRYYRRLPEVDDDWLNEGARGL